MDYANFDLTVEPAPEGGYRARVKGREGDAASDFPAPVSPVELENLVLRIGRLRSSTRRIESPEMEATKAIGGRLYTALFSEDVRRLFREDLEAAAERGAGLRIRLDLRDAPGLLDLPWEYLYDPARNTFLTLSQKTPLVRYLDLGRPPALLNVESPLRALVMIADTSEEGKLDVEREWDLLRESLEPLRAEGLVEVERLPEATLPALTRHLLRSQYHVFHFIGHGGFDERKQDGSLVLEGRSGRPDPVSGQDLGMLLQDHDTLRLAVLNACDGARTSSTDPFAGVAQTLVQQGLPAVIAMQFEITDDAAILFASEFYGALAGGRPVDTALSAARRMIYANGNRLEWGTPVLYTRVPDGCIFRMAQPGEPIMEAVPEDAASGTIEGEAGVGTELSDAPGVIRSEVSLSESDPSLLEDPSPPTEETEAESEVPTEGAEPVRGEDLRATISLTRDEAREGGLKTLKVKGLTRKVQFPVGVTDGQEIALSGWGRPGRNGGPSGDLTVTIKVSDPEPVRGANVTAILTLSPSEAVSGGKKTITTGGRSVEVDYPAGSRSGQTLTFSGQGEPGRHGGEDGDLLVTLQTASATPTGIGETVGGIVMSLVFLFLLIYGLNHLAEWKDAALVKLGIARPVPNPSLSYDPTKFNFPSGGNAVGGLNSPYTLDPGKSILNNPPLGGSKSFGSANTTTGLFLPSRRTTGTGNFDKWLQARPSRSTTTGGPLGSSTTSGTSGLNAPSSNFSTSKEADRKLLDYLEERVKKASSGGNSGASPPAATTVP